MAPRPGRRWWFRATAPAPQLGLSPGAWLAVAGGWGRLDAPRTPLLSPTTLLVALAPARLRFVRPIPAAREAAS